MPDIAYAEYRLSGAEVTEADRASYRGWNDDVSDEEMIAVHRTVCRGSRPDTHVDSALACWDEPTCEAFGRCYALAERRTWDADARARGER